MPFLGQESVQAEDTTLATFTYKTFGGKEVSVQAHYIQFMPAHVAFFKDLGNDMNLLVLAEANSNVHGLRELP